MGKLNVPFNTVRNAVVGLLLLVLGGVVGYRYGQRNALSGQVSFKELINTKVPVEKQTIDFNTFWEVWSTLEAKYVDPTKIDPKNMVDGAISGMTSAIGDPYTIYLPPVDNKRVAEEFAGTFFGIGTELGYIDKTLAVVAPLKDMPAAKAGIQAGDLILHVKDEAKGLDEDTTGWTLDEAVEKIRGEKGTLVTLTILRRKEDEAVQPFEVSIKRDEVVVNTVDLTFVEHDGKRVANLKISRFGERTPAEFDVAVEQILLERKKINGIILDLRNNPGGYFNDALEMASEFIEDGTIVTQKGKYEEESFEATGVARLKGTPLIVLVNKGSASASEIVAGALRDQVGARLVGETTFGKGTVQDRLPLSNGGGVHVTIAKWLLPKGDWIHENGIPVQVEVKDVPETADIDEALNKAIEEL